MWSLLIFFILILRYVLHYSNRQQAAAATAGHGTGDDDGKRRLPPDRTHAAPASNDSGRRPVATSTGVVMPRRRVLPKARRRSVTSYGVATSWRRDCWGVDDAGSALPAARRHRRLGGAGGTLSEHGRGGVEGGAS